MATSLTYQDGSSAPFQLKITSNEDYQQFLKDILEDFLGKVDVVETGLIDSLISCGVLTDSDTESLDGREVRIPRDKARKLYLILEKLPVGVFVSRVGPVLCSKFPHIIPVNFQTEVGELAGVLETDEKERANYCLRCSIRRYIRVNTMADLLYGDGRLETLTYKAITAICYEDHWEKIFQAFENQKMEVTEKLTNGVRKVLQRHFIAIPENLSVSLEHGLPCECSNSPLSQKNSLSVIKVMAWQQADENATSVSVALGNMLSDQTPLELLSDGEEADDEDSSPHYPGSEEPFSTRNIKDFESESSLSSSDVLSPNYYWGRQRYLIEVHETFERLKRKVMTWQQADESATSVSVALGNMLSDQTPLELLSDGEEAEDEDSSPHYPGSDGSEETFVTCDEDFENARKAWQQADESASNVSVAISIMLSDQMPLELLSDGEEADDEDSSTHYLGSEETFSSRNITDFENEWLPSSSDALSGTTIFVDPQPYLPEVYEEFFKKVYFYYLSQTGRLVTSRPGLKLEMQGVKSIFGLLRCTSRKSPYDTCQYYVASGVHGCFVLLCVPQSDFFNCGKRNNSWRAYGGEMLQDYRAEDIIITRKKNTQKIQRKKNTKKIQPNFQIQQPRPRRLNTNKKTITLH